MKIYRYVRSNTEVLEPYMSGDAVELKNGKQKYSSKATAVNGKQGKLPKIFKLIPWRSGTINLDYGGGTPDADVVADAYLEPRGVTNVIYDKFNQTDKHNQAVLRFLDSKGGADTATLSNVLNVIAEPEIRLEILEDIYQHLKPNGVLYIMGYEGSRAQQEQGGRATGEDQYQTFMKTKEYLGEVSDVFPDAKYKGGMIICPKTASMAASSRVRGRSISAGRTRIDEWLEDLQETGFGYDNPSDFDNEAELNDAMSAEVRWYEQPVPKEYTGNLPELCEEDMYDPDEDSLIFV